MNPWHSSRQLQCLLEICSAGVKILYWFMTLLYCTVAFTTAHSQNQIIIIRGCYHLLFKMHAGFSTLLLMMGKYVEFETKCCLYPEGRIRIISKKPFLSLPPSPLPFGFLSAKEYVRVCKQIRIKCKDGTTKCRNAWSCSRWLLSI